MNLSDEEIEKLKHIIQWWNSRRVFDEDTTTIKFHRKNPKVASVRIGGKMYQDAVALAENDPDIKNFSRLVELLLWERLGKSDEYLLTKLDKQDSDSG